ncbi:MAG: hypothetical protein H6862_06695 [Rhodospirillales bacterium]|nr:hypothetical protein [Rhodospirillales bacterium]
MIPLTLMTRFLGTLYLMVSAGLLLLFLYAIVRGRANVSMVGTLALIFGWPLVLLNDRLRRRLWTAINPN